MAEIIQKDGTWAFVGDRLRLTPGRDRNVSPIRRALGELEVPLDALAGVSFEQGRRSGRLRLRLRDGADPLLRATAGRLAESDDPYRLTVDSDRYGVAEYVAEEVRTALLLEGVPSGPVTGYRLPGPPLPVSAAAGDGTAAFDGERVRLEWNWKTEDAKAATGPRTIPLAEITAVRWQPAAGLENGHLRFTVRGAPVTAPPKFDPNAVELWGFRKDPLMALVAAAVQVRLPHPSAPAAGALAPAGAPAPVEALVPRQAEAPTGAPAAEDDHDALLRRLRELGELHRSGVLTDEEFTLAKRAVLSRM
ncbi:DUF4429 domain-containing protein [Streptomyces sp. NPDC002520]